jgi:hypothetical protein
MVSRLRLFVSGSSPNLLKCFLNVFCPNKQTTTKRTFDVHYFTFLLLVAHTHDTVTASTTAGMIAAVQIQGIVIG